METNQKFVGSFQVTGGVIRVGDPAFDYEQNGDLILNCQDGTWQAYVIHTPEGRVAELIVHHENLEEPILGSVELDDLTVDTGMMGVWDAETDLREQSDEKMLAATGTSLHATIIDNVGIVCSSGYGDGFYEGTVTRDINGFARYISITFIELDDGE